MALKAPYGDSSVLAGIEKWRWVLFTWLALLLTFGTSNVQSFRRPVALVRRSNHSMKTRSPVTLQEAASDKEDSERKKKATLTFHLNTQFDSNPLPEASPEQISAFLSIPENRNLFLTEGGKQPLEEKECTPELYEIWTKAAKKQAGATLPEKNDPVLSVTSGGVKFPGLTLVTKSIIGCKLIRDDSPYPSYQLFLLGDERSVTGAPPVVWIFNKLMGGSGEKDGESASSTSVFTTIKVSDDGTERRFSSAVSFVVNISFPAFLLRILPTTKEKAESQGTAAIEKSVGKSVSAALSAVEDAFRSFIAS